MISGGYIALPSMRDIERLERRIEELNEIVNRLATLIVAGGWLRPNDIRAAYGLEDWHGKAKGSE